MDYNGISWISVTVYIILPDKIALHAALFLPTFLTKSVTEAANRASDTDVKLP